MESDGKSDAVDPSDNNRFSMDFLSNAYGFDFSMGFLHWNLQYFFKKLLFFNLGNIFREFAIGYL